MVMRMERFAVKRRKKYTSRRVLPYELFQIPLRLAEEKETEGHKWHGGF